MSIVGSSFACYVAMTLDSIECLCAIVTAIGHGHKLWVMGQFRWVSGSWVTLLDPLPALSLTAKFLFPPIHVDNIRAVIIVYGGKRKDYQNRSVTVYTTIVSNRIHLSSSYRCWFRFWFSVWFICFLN